MSDPPAKESNPMPQAIQHFDFQKLVAVAYPSAVVI
jgi:hypothetical protein